LDRAKFNACIAQGMRGKQLTKEERAKEFCITAKMCSGKAKSRDDAIRICSMPKPPKPIGFEKRSKKPFDCEKDSFKLAHCIVEKIDMDQARNINSIEMAIANAMMQCRCPNG